MNQKSLDNEKERFRRAQEKQNLEEKPVSPKKGEREIEIEGKREKATNWM